MSLGRLIKTLVERSRGDGGAAERERIAAINKETEKIKSESKEYRTNRSKEAQKRAEAWKAEREGWYKNTNAAPIEAPGYTPEQRPEAWETPEWGSRDIIRTPPRKKPKKEDNEYRPKTKGYYVPTEKEIRLEDERWTREQKAKEFEPWQQRPDPGTEFMGGYNRWERNTPTYIINR